MITSDKQARHAFSHRSAVGPTVPCQQTQERVTGRSYSYLPTYWVLLRSDLTRNSSQSNSMHFCNLHNHRTLKVLRLWQRDTSSSQDRVGPGPNHQIQITMQAVVYKMVHIVQAM